MGLRNNHDENGQVKKIKYIRVTIYFREFFLLSDRKRTSTIEDEK